VKFGEIWPLLYNAYMADLTVLQSPSIMAATYADDSAFLTVGDAATELMQTKLNLLDA